MNHQEQSNHSKRVEIFHTINAPIKDVFPLACPVMEYKWIPDWKCELVHCPNGHVELGTIFNELFSAPMLADSIRQKTTWTAVLYDTKKYRVHYRLNNQISTCLYKIEFEAVTSEKTKSRIEITYSPLNDKGICNMENGGEEKLLLMLSGISLMLEYYCEQGEMIKSSEIMKLASRFKQITPRDRMRLLINKLMMMLMKDNDKKRFLKGLPICKVKST